MTDLLGIGRSGVLAYQSALSTVGENVVNAQTPGYARRQVNLKELSGGRTSPYYLPHTSFGGVSATGVSRAWDDYKAAESRADSADYGRADARSRWLTTTQTALDDGATGVGKQMTAVFNAADALAADPTSNAPRNQFLLAINSTTGAMRTAAAALDSASAGIADEMGNAVTAINGDLAQLAQVNAAMMRAPPGSVAAADGADQRDRLIDDIAGRINVSVTLDERGVATLAVGGIAAQTLVSGVDGRTINVTRAADGRLALALLDGPNQQSAILPSGGTLSGLSDMANMVADRRQTLDGIATGFAATLNAWSAAGRGKTGAAGTDLVALGGGGAATIAAIAIDPDAVAAASSTAANGNALALASVRGTGGLEDRWSSMISIHAQVLAAANSEETATSARKDAAFAARDATSGVDLDSEAGDLLRYQQAYSGSAKIIQAARETLQDILNLFS